MKEPIYYFLLVTIPLIFWCNGALGQSDNTKILQRDIKLTDGERLAEKYGCFACHKIYGPKIGPAYNGVSIKYRKEFDEKAADSIAFYIKKGSKGKYPCYMTKDAVMPPFNILEVERMAIADWIVSLRPMKDMYLKQDEEKE